MQPPATPKLRPSRAALALAALALASPRALVAQRHALASDPVLPAGLPALARAAVSDDAPLASRAVAALRARGSAGLDALVASQPAAVARLRADPTGALRDPSVARARAAIDAVAAQRDAWAEGLYWFTDEAAARAEARRTRRNEQQRHRALHAWLAAPGAVRELAPVDARVYAELFLTPSSDPWLGLRSDGLFTGLEDEVQATPR